MSQEERRPLLNPQLPPAGGQDGYQATVTVDTPRLEGEFVTGVVEVGPVRPAVGGAAVGPDGAAIDGGGTPLPCRVCGETLDVETGSQQHVVKCTKCNEATPVRMAPLGKKYVRCPCNCLLICRTTSQRIACPRPACKRVISLPADGAGAGAGPSAASPRRQPNQRVSLVTPPPPTVPGMCRVTCVYCRDNFLFNSLTNALARCPHCRRVSSVGNRYARSRGTGFLIAAVIVLSIGVGVTLGTYSYAQQRKGIYIVYVGAFLAALLLFLRAIYYFTLRVSYSDRSHDG